VKSELLDQSNALQAFSRGHYVLVWRVFKPELINPRSSSGQLARSEGVGHGSEVLRGTALGAFGGFAPGDESLVGTERLAFAEVGRKKRKITSLHESPPSTPCNPDEKAAAPLE